MKVSKYNHKILRPYVLYPTPIGLQINVVNFSSTIGKIEILNTFNLLY